MDCKGSKVFCYRPASGGSRGGWGVDAPIAAVAAVAAAAAAAAAEYPGTF
eukprot:GDKH01000193.1.p1 GENE.GDKH01000193.1~~GDKH01000193.1.p1  ORF type:complete len:50 (+),score=7.34 GDKH01000193.1:77-226(+)